MSSVFGQEIDVDARAKRANWINMFRRDFVNKFGQHMLICGITGSGKTQAMFWVVDEINAAETKETILWFDTGKSDVLRGSTEFLTLLAFDDLNVLVPEGCNIEIKNEEVAELVKIRHFNVKNFWDKLDRKRINVATIEPFLKTDPVLYGKIFVELFKQLIEKAHNLSIKTPMAIFFDEFHRICPPRPQEAISRKHYMIGNILQMNIERLRSLGIRFVASTHGMTKMRSAVRSSFQWRLYKRYIGGLTDEDRMKDYKALVMRLKEDEAIIVYPNGTFSDILSLPFYGYFGGFVSYEGELSNDFLKDRNKDNNSQTYFISAVNTSKKKGFSFSGGLLEAVKGVVANRVNLYLEHEDNEVVAVCFEFDEDGKYSFVEGGYIWALTFYKQADLIKKIKGRSFKVEVDEDRRAVIGFWEVNNR